VIVKVTAQDIKNGECGSPFDCPVARAVTRTLKAAKRLPKGICPVGVGSSIRIGKERQTAPVSVQRFVQKFDGGEQVQPFAFRISI
jgi:hypothetical protein